jgi:hypothetical protein
MGMTVTGWGAGYLAGAPIVSMEMLIVAGTRTNKLDSLTFQAGFLLGKPSAKMFIKKRSLTSNSVQTRMAVPIKDYRLIDQRCFMREV